MKYFIVNKETKTTIKIFDTADEAIEYLSHHYDLCYLEMLKME